MEVAREVEEQEERWRPGVQRCGEDWSRRAQRAGGGGQEDGWRRRVARCGGDWARKVEVGAWVPSLTAAPHYSPSLPILPIHARILPSIHKACRCLGASLIALIFLSHCVLQCAF